MKRLPLLLAAVAVAIVTAVAPASAAPPTRNSAIAVKYGISDPFMVEISPVSAGFVVSATPDRPAVAKITDTTGSMGGTLGIFEMTQTMSVAVEDPSSTGRNAVRLRGTSAARLTSVATKAVLEWPARVSAYGQCWVFAGLKTDTSRGTAESTCTTYHITAEHSGAISGPNGRGNCGSLRQRIKFSVVRDAGGPWKFGAFLDTEHDDDDDKVDGFGQLTISSSRCRDLILGVMPGDNIT